MDTIGAFAGPALAMLLMVLSGDDFRLVFWIAVVPAFIAVAVILFGVRKPNNELSSEPRRFPIWRVSVRLSCCCAPIALGWRTPTRRWSLSS